MERKCILCCKTKPIDEFIKVRGRGYGQRCIPCRARISEHTTRFYSRNPNKRYIQDPHRRIEGVYGMQKGEYPQLVEAQNGKCAICQTETKLNVDHCHTTGRVRQLLCHGCNVGLGFFKDNIELMKQAIGYLERHKSS